MFTALYEPNLFNPWITEQKIPTFTDLGTYCTHIFKIIFSAFQCSVNRLN